MHLWQTEEGGDDMFEERDDASGGKKVVAQLMGFAVAVAGVQSPEQLIGIGGRPEIDRHAELVGAQSEMRRIGLQSAEHRGGHPFLPEYMDRVAEQGPEHRFGYRVETRFGDSRWGDEAALSARLAETGT